MPIQPEQKLSEKDREKLIKALQEKHYDPYFEKNYNCPMCGEKLIIK
jgi:competence CoiA-like predicted nuclease